MSEALTAVVVANTAEPIDRIETALDEVYDGVTVLESTDGRPAVDCVVAVAPLSDDEWAVVEDAAASESRPPVVVVASESEAGGHPDPEMATVTDVVAGGEDRFERLANRVRGMVEMRRSDD